MLICVFVFGRFLDFLFFLDFVLFICPCDDILGRSIKIKIKWGGG